MQSCFVIMPIGSIEGGPTESELRERYTSVIKEALVRAVPSLEVTRADEVATPGAISSDILMRIMHADLVVADISYPNPNVYYELGLRHAARPGTILLRHKDSPPLPFDIYGLRHIQFDDTAGGLKKLSEDIGRFVRELKGNPTISDSGFLEIAKISKFQYPKTGAIEPESVKLQTSLVMKLMQNKKLLAAMTSGGGEMTPELLQDLMQDDPDLFQELVGFMISKGQFKLA